MNLIERLYTLIIFLAVIIGISIGHVELIRTKVESFIVPLLIAMLYITFLQIPIEEIKKSFKNIQFTYTSVIINFVWTPILAWILALLTIFLSLAIVAMFASQGNLLLDNLDLMWQITIPILLFFGVNLFISQKVGQFMKFPYTDRTSLSLTTLREIHQLL